MKKIVLAIFFMSASAAWAEDDVVARAVAVDEVEERISVIEVIDVTSEKTPTLTDVEPDEDIDSILDEVDVLEQLEETE